MMKRLFAPVLALLVMASCNTAELEQANSDYEALLAETRQRDSAMLELVETLNLIDDNIQKINEKKEQIDMYSNDPEFQQDQRDKILEDIQEIYETMEENKGKIKDLRKRLAAVQNKLKKSDENLEEANKLITQYQTMIENLNERMAMKDEEIMALQEELGEMNISLDSLSSAYEEKTDLAEAQEKELKTAYYAFGNKKELTYHGIITKKGGIAGIGSTKQLKSDFDRSYFTEIDIDEVTTIDLYVKKASLISNHPEAAYHFVGEDKVDQLVIDKPEEFWSSSKYLVILVE